MNEITHERYLPAPSSTGAGVPSGEILVFKTNLSDAERINEISSCLDIHPGIHQWNVDLNDCDNILRVVSKSIMPAEVENMIMGAGYYCEEL